MCNIITNFIKAELIFVLVQLLFVFKDIIWNIYEMKLEWDIFHFENFFQKYKKFRKLFTYLILCYMITRKR